MLTYFQFSPYFLLSLGLSILGQLLKKVKIKMLYRTLNMKHNFFLYSKKSIITKLSILIERNML